jgi:hypothetical protein
LSPYCEPSKPSMSAANIAVQPLILRPTLPTLSRRVLSTPGRTEVEAAAFSWRAMTLLADCHGRVAPLKSNAPVRIPV